MAGGNASAWLYRQLLPLVQPVGNPRTLWIFLSKTCPKHKHSVCIILFLTCIQFVRVKGPPSPPHEVEQDGVGDCLVRPRLELCIFNFL
jgi:hypothetical protein